MRIRGFVAVVVAALLFAACGSSGKSASDVPTSTTVATAPNTPAQLATDKATAVASVLRLSDLTAGYKKIPPDPSSHDDAPPAVLKRFAACAHIPEKKAAELLNSDHGSDQPRAESDYMKKESDLLETDLESDVELDRSAKDISEPLAVLEKAPLRCWQGLFDTALSQTPIAGATLSPVQVTSLPTTGLGDQALAFRAGVTISAAPISVRTSIDLYFVGRGRAGVTLTATGVGRPADPAFERSMLEKVLQRVDAAASAAPQ